MKKTLFFLLSLMLCLSTVFAAERGIQRVQLSSPSPVETPYLSGKYRALVIGNNDYNDPKKFWPSLKTAVADAEAVANILKTDYGFAEITLLKNAKQRDIVRAFNNLAKTSQDSDSILVYYAGHGYLNEETKEGFWIPVDAEGRDDSTFVANAIIKTKLGVIADKARHVLLVSDSCFSGALLREGNRGMTLDQKNERYYQKVAKKKSVQILAAGGLEFVDDNYKGTRHSPFTYYFLQSLKDNNARYFEATDLSQETSRNVSINTMQTPESGVLQGAGHAGGEFFFLRKKTSEALSKIESKPALPEKPSTGSFSLADLDAHADEEESVRKAWQQKQKEMNAALKKVRSYNQRNVSPSLKAEAWRRFIAAFSEDNPYSSEDEDLRNEAQNQITNWQQMQKQQEANKKRLAEAKRKAEAERKKQNELAALQQKQQSKRKRTSTTITIASWGGAYTMSQQKAYADTFPNLPNFGGKANFVNYNGGLGEIRTQVESGTIKWDIVDVLPHEARVGCDEGLFEKLPRDVFAKAPDGTPMDDDIIVPIPNDCVVPQIFWSYMPFYKRGTFYGTLPSTIADFFNVRKFPGKRGIHTWPNALIEMALMADGVAPKNVYKEMDSYRGIERAFAKLDTIKNHVVFWSGGQESIELVSSGEVSMGLAYNGRIGAAILSEGAPFVPIWDGQVLEEEWLVMVKGTKKYETALDFLIHASAPKQQAAQAKWINYGPMRKSALDIIRNNEPWYVNGMNIMEHMNTREEVLPRSVFANADWWVENGYAVEERYEAWKGN